MRVLFTLFLVLPIVQACVPMRLRPEVTRRYRQISHVEDLAGRHAELTAFSLSVPGSDPNNILALAPEAQAEFVKGVAAHAGTGRAIAAGIAAPIRSDVPPPGARNLARISRRVVFSIENRSRNPADRLHSARIRMRLADTAMSYVSWDKIATKHNTVDVGSLSFTQGTEVGAELGLTLPVLSAAPKVSGSATSGMNESVTLRHRFVDLNGALTGREAVLLQQSTAGIDLTGNVIADFVVDVEERQPEWFYAFSGDPGTCEQAAIRGEYNDIATSTRPRRADVTLEYVLRRVDEGGATITESDDVVSFVRARDEASVELIPESALIVNSWYVRTDSTPTGVLQLQSIRGGLGLELLQPVQFVSYEDAERMVQWLRRCKGSIPGFRVSLAGGSPETRNLYIDRVIANTDPIVGPRKRSPARSLAR